MSDINNHISAARARLDAFAQRVGVEPFIIYLALAFLVVFVLAAIIVPSQSAPHPAAPAPLAAASPPKQPVASSTTAPAKVAAVPASSPASLMQAELPALTLSPNQVIESGAWQLRVESVQAVQGQDPASLPAQLIGTIIQSSPSASFSGAIPSSIAPFITPGQPARLAYNFDFDVPTSGSYLLTAVLGGKASGEVRLTLDDRADTQVSLARKYNAIWTPNAPPVTASSTVNLAAGLHTIEAILDTKATTDGGAAPVLDFYIKPQAASLPTAMVPMWPAARR
ncbi:conserved hypothetical protein [Thiomonas sp. X19]|uniref:hypothetical protein n=1 Tax=Thiomonas sp. X19 TaxID=1050370 RepID=UPI000B731B2B|nr:hypothetical protein [Thiomonas sp. X19]SCC95097.1 conserved hypothetical protein [Thiomonas sp. X19]